MSLQYITCVHLGSHVDRVGSVWAPPSGVMVYRTVQTEKMSPNAVRYWDGNPKCSSLTYTPIRHCYPWVRLFVLHSSPAGDWFPAAKLFIRRRCLVACMCWELEWQLREYCVCADGLRQVLIVYPRIYWILNCNGTQSICIHLHGFHNVTQQTLKCVTYIYAQLPDSILCRATFCCIYSCQSFGVYLYCDWPS